MNRTMSRRTVLGLAGAGALSLTGLRALPARAQDIASPYTFPNGKVLTWADPWGVGGNNGIGFFPGSSYLNLLSNGKSQLVVGYFDAPTTIDDLTKTVLTTLWGDPALPQNIGGGSGQKVGPGGKVESESAYRVHTMTTPDGIVWGLYVELINKTDYTLLVTPVPDFAASVTSAQTSVALDGVGVLGGVDGAKIQQTMEPSAGAAAATTDGAAAAGGQYTIPSGNIDVVWPAGWSVVGQDDTHIQLTNASQTMLLQIAGLPFNGNTWDQAAALIQSQYFGDQGADATISGPVVTENGFMFTTDGQYGPRMLNAFASNDPLVFVGVLAHTIQPGADLAALATEANGVTANGVPVLQGIEAVIPPATAAAAGGQYTIPTGNINVAWPAGWTIVSQNNDGIQLTNASQTMVLLIQGLPLDGDTWENSASLNMQRFFGDQGASATISGPVVTESGFMFTTDGQYGPRMVNAFASSDPTIAVFVLAHTIQPGADLTALATEANGVTANGVPVLQGIEAVIPPAA